MLYTLKMDHGGLAAREMLQRKWTFKMKFIPESYSVSICKENEEGEVFYVGRVAEFPYISVFEDTFEAAHMLIIDAIQTLKKIADETQADFPLPQNVRINSHLQSCADCVTL